jgi:hypothetical protein
MRLGPELQPILTQLRRVYPDGIVPDGDYWALLLILQEDMSIEALTKVVAELVDEELVVIENHAAEAASVRRPRPIDVDRVHRLLRDAGWQTEGE